MVESKINRWIKKEILNQSVYKVNNKNTPIKLNQNESPVDWPIAIREKLLLSLPRTNFYAKLLEKVQMK